MTAPTAQLEQALARLAIFPLPDVTMFPGMILPLHVFEPRYVEMTRDVVAGSGLMAVVRLRRGYEDDYLGRPPVHPVATVGELVACEELPGDRLAILLRGLERIEIERELAPVRAFREVMARRLDDRPFDEESGAADRAQLGALCERLATHLGDEPAARLRALVHRAGSTAQLTMALAGALVEDPDARQELLEERAPAARMARLLDHMTRLLVRTSPPPAAN